MNKKELRALMRSMRDRHREETTKDLEELAEYLREWDTVLLYWSIDGEVNTHALVERLHKEGYRVLLPRVVSDTEITLHTYAGREQMRSGVWSGPCGRRSCAWAEKSGLKRNWRGSVPKKAG